MNKALEYEMKLLNKIVKPTGQKFGLEINSMGCSLILSKNGTEYSLSGLSNDEEFMSEYIQHLQDILTVFLTDFDGLQKLLNLTKVGAKTK